LGIEPDNSSCKIRSIGEGKGQTKTWRGNNVKLINASKVSLIVAGCLSLTVYAMAQGRSGGHAPTTSGGSGGFGPGGPNSYGPTNNPGLTHMSDQGLQSSLFGRNTAQNAIDEHRPSPTATASVTSTTTKKGKRSTHSTLKSGNKHETTTTSATANQTSAPVVSPTISPPYGPTNNPGLTHMSDQGLQSSQQGRDTAQNAIDTHRPGASPTATP
jgi:hypothetical protein